MNNFCKIAFCFALLCLSAFVQVPFSRYDFVVESWVSFDYSIQFLLCYILAIVFARNYVSFAVVLYIVVGVLGLPIFAFGGGFKYILEPGFGYLLVMIPLSMWTFNYKKIDAFIFLPSSILNNVCPLAMFLAHALGLGFLLITFRLNLMNFMSLSFYQFIYDMLFATLIAFVYSYFSNRFGATDHQPEQERFNEFPSADTPFAAQ